MYSVGLWTAILLITGRKKQNPEHVYWMRSRLPTRKRRSFLLFRMLSFGLGKKGERENELQILDLNESADHSLNYEFGGRIKQSGHEIVRSLLIRLKVNKSFYLDVHGLGRIGEIVLEGVHSICHRELGLVDSGGDLGKYRCTRSRWRLDSRCS